MDMGDADIEEEDRQVAFIDPPLLSDLPMANIEIVPGAAEPTANLQLVVLVYRVEWSTEKKMLNHKFASIFRYVLQSITFKVRVCNLTHTTVQYNRILTLHLVRAVGVWIFAMFVVWVGFQCAIANGGSSANCCQCYCYIDTLLSCKYRRACAS
jgi:hypothetical protein